MSNVFICNCLSSSGGVHLGLSSKSKICYKNKKPYRAQVNMYSILGLEVNNYMDYHITLNSEALSSV